MSEKAPDQWERLERLYHAARERPAAERSTFLAEACGADTALRRDVESLLSQDGGDGFLETRTPKSAESLTNTSPGAAFPGGALRVYEIQGHIGAGGMGEVYRARDTTLGRDVAIKVLPRSVSDDPDRRARFEREARLLAALNHPHIAQVYGFEEFDGGHALVMEFVEGDTLDKMIGDRKRRSGALPIARALAFARQIADPLDAAHEKGIVHRDLKPSNVKVTPAGIVKVLDFGLAKAVEPVVAVAAITTEVSRQPVILGTIPYMSPEQARGEPVDKRSDIWAFGCVLFEMLTGRAPFEGDTASDTLLRILSREPDWASLPAGTPPSVRTLLDRCLRKDPNRRLHDIADARIELDDAERPAGAADVRPRPAPTGWQWFAMIASLVLVASVSVTVLLSRRGAPVTADPYVEFPIVDAPRQGSVEAGIGSEFAISPDGQQITVAASLGDTSFVWVRSVTGPPWRQLVGTEGAINPFWKPDSQSIGFFIDEKPRKLKTVKVGGGLPSLVCEVPGARPMYGAWGSRDVILFSSEDFLQQVVVAAGSSKPATTQVNREVHRSPSFLPDGDHFLYLSQAPKGEGQLRVGSLSDRAKTDSLGPLDSNAVYAAGYLLFVQADRRLMARPFDADSRRFTGEPKALAEDVAFENGKRGRFSVSTTGRLTYRQPSTVFSQLTWFNRKGIPLKTVGKPDVATNLNLSRDGLRVLESKVIESPGQPPNWDVWMIDAGRSDSESRLTTDPTTESDPAWSHDESRIVFLSYDQNVIQDREYTLFQRSSSGTGDNVFLTKAAIISTPEWSPDDRVVMFTRQSARGNGKPTQPFELWTIEPSGDRVAKPFLKEAGYQANGAFLPTNGRWIAYEADYAHLGSAHSEIFVIRFPEADKRIPISTNGGRAPRWSGDGKELFFLGPDDTLMVAHIETVNGVLKASVPEQLFRTGLNQTGFAAHPYVVTKDGQMFLMPKVLELPRRAPVTAVMNWPAKLGK
jgi:serine/threonine protein kinase/Tol biopolymer transport system component